MEWSTDPREGWTWAHAPDSTRVMSTPSVGQLTDDNGDGVIDGRDSPDIAVVTFARSNWYTTGSCAWSRAMAPRSTGA